MKEQTKKKYKIKLDCDFDWESILLWAFTLLVLGALVGLAILVVTSAIKDHSYALLSLLLVILVPFAVAGYTHVMMITDMISFRRIEIKPPLTEEEKAERAKAEQERELRAAFARVKSALSAHDWLMDRYPTEKDLPANTTYQALEEVVLKADKEFLMNYGPEPVSTRFGFESFRHDHRQGAIDNYCAYLPYQLALEQHEREVQQYEERYNIAKDEVNQERGE